MGRRGTSTWVGALAAVLWLSGSATAAGAAQEGDTNVGGSWSMTFRITSSDAPDQPVGDTFEQVYLFPADCGPERCEVERSDDSGEDLDARDYDFDGNGFSYQEAFKVDCSDTATGEVTAPNGADFSRRVTLTTGDPVERGGVAYASTITGEGTDTLTINAAGLATACTIDGVPGGPTTQTVSYAISGVQNPLPTEIVEVPDDDVPPVALAVTPSGPDGAVTVRTAALGPQLSDRQQAAVDAVDRGDRSVFPASVATLSEAASSRSNRLVVNGLLSLLLVLLIVFPAQVFNSTYEENHARIDPVIGRWLRRRRRVPQDIAATTTDEAAKSSPIEKPRAAGRVRRTAVFSAVALAGALLAGFLDPGFGLNTPSYALFIGVFLSIVVGITLAGLISRSYRRLRRLSAEAVLRAIPLGLLFAAIGVGVSRLLHFTPGYLYGLVGGLAFAVSLDRKEEGRTEWLILVWTLVASTVAWFVFVRVDRFASQPDPDLAVLVADSLLAALFIGGIEGLLFGLVPLKFLPGYRVSRWSWVAWIVLALLVAFTFVNVLLRPVAGYLGRPTDASTAVTLGLFAAFGLASALFWGYFRLRPTKPGDAAPA